MMAEEPAAQAPGLRSRLRRGGLLLLGTVAFVAIGIAAENTLGIPFRTTFRVACAATCLIVMAWAASDYPGQRWPLAALAVAALVDLGIVFTPLLDRPASRGEIMLFAIPDAAIFLTARIATYPVVDDHRRAVRQQLILGLILALALSAIPFALMLMPPRGAHSGGDRPSLMHNRIER